LAVYLGSQWIHSAGSQWIHSAGSQWIHSAGSQWIHSIQSHLYIYWSTEYKNKMSQKVIMIIHIQTV